MIIADTSGLLALFNVREPAHRAVRELVESEDARMVISPYVVAELDYLVATRLGVAAEMAVLEELAGGAYALPAFGPNDLSAAIDVLRRHPAQAISAADASIVVLADRMQTTRVLTLDRRHFDVLRPMSGDHFTIVP
ncbi:type II toxin-antitoxin system toxin ribonuclease C26 [soil metagenome]